MSRPSFSQIVRDALAVSDADATAELLCAGWRTDGTFWYAPLGYVRAYVYLTTAHVALAVHRVETAGKVDPSLSRHRVVSLINEQIVAQHSPLCLSCGGTGEVLCEDCGASGEDDGGERCATCSTDGAYACTACDGVQVVDDNSAAVLLSRETIARAKRNKAAARLAIAEAEYRRLATEEMALWRRRVSAQCEQQEEESAA